MAFTDTMDAFSDADLASALGTSPDGVVVYLWSPHMPLSVDGYQEVRRAADSVGLPLIPLLFAGSDTAFARREAERMGMPDEALRTVASRELLRRDLLVHAPSLLLVTPGRTSPVLPGYRDAEGYRRWLDRQLAR